MVVAASLASSPAAARDPIPDLSTLSFTGAFDSLCAHYSKYYAFSDWKGIDWPALHGLYAPEVQQAEAAADTARFRLAMKRFASSFPDGHVRLRGTPKALYESDIGGGFGEQVPITAVNFGLMPASASSFNAPDDSGVISLGWLKWMFMNNGWYFFRTLTR